MEAKSPTTVGRLLESCLDGVAGRPGAAAIWRVWGDVVGPQVARRAQPVRLRGRTLLVAVSSAPWMQELQLLKRTILAELNTRLATPLVDDLFFVLTSLTDEQRDGGRAASADPKPTRRARSACPPAPSSAADVASLPSPLRDSLDALARAWRRRASS